LYLTGNTLRLHYRAQPVNAVWEIIAVYSENHKEYINTIRRQNVGFLNIKADGIYNNHYALKGKINGKKNNHDQICLI
jgi:hypothetical protein